MLAPYLLSPRVRLTVRLSQAAPTAAQLVDNYDDTLFTRLINSKPHVLHQLLPSNSEHDYDLRPRPRNLSLSYSMDHRNFISRLAFNNTY